MAGSSSTVAALAVLLLMVVAAGAQTKKEAQAAAKEAQAAAKKGAQAKDAQLKELQQQAGFDYLVLARTWPPSLCELDPCSQPTYNLFTIHGLWPSNNNGSWPEDCAGQAFNKDLLSPELRGRMSCEWRNFKTGNLANFWSYEWNKHGKCAAPLFNGSSGSLPEYFNQTVALNEQWDINEALVQAKFNPLSATSATAAQVVALLKAQWNVTTAVTCAKGNIYEVKTCFNLLLEPMNCPPATATTCPRNAMDLPYGNDDIPQVCQTYFDNIPKASNPDAPAAAVESSARLSTAAPGAAALLLAAAAAALATL